MSGGGGGAGGSRRTRSLKSWRSSDTGRPHAPHSVTARLPADVDVPCYQMPRIAVDVTAQPFSQKEYSGGYSLVGFLTKGVCSLDGNLEAQEAGGSTEIRATDAPKARAGSQPTANPESEEAPQSPRQSMLPQPSAALASAKRNAGPAAAAATAVRATG